MFAGGPARRIAIGVGALAGTRQAIDHVDDAVLILVGLRRFLVDVARRSKRSVGLPLRDTEREADVFARARRMAAHVSVPDDTAEDLMRILISDACRQQARFPLLPPTMNIAQPHSSKRASLLRLLPPPRFWKPVLTRLPRAAHQRFAEWMLARAIARFTPGTLDVVAGRRLGIVVDDLGLQWVFAWSDGLLRACGEPAEATVRGSATDLLLLVNRLEDADTLFFQRRLTLTGDVELGLTVRNLLDRMRWADLPLGLRIALHRGSRLLQAARDAYHGR